MPLVRGSGRETGIAEAQRLAGPIELQAVSRVKEPPPQRSALRHIDPPIPESERGWAGDDQRRLDASGPKALRSHSRPGRSRQVERDVGEHQVIQRPGPGGRDSEAPRQRLTDHAMPTIINSQ